MSGARSWVLLMIVALGCEAPTGSDAGARDGSTRGDGGPTATPNVTPEAGGTVVSDDGLVSLAVPAGAVEEPVRITIVRRAAGEIPPALAEVTNATVVYELLPDGLVFAIPATATVRLAPELEAAIDFSQPLGSRHLATWSGGPLELVDTEIEIDLAAETMTLGGPIEHFSDLLYVQGAMTFSFSPPSIDTFAPDRWTARLDIDTLRLPEGDRTSAFYEYLEGLERAGLSNPPAFRVRYVGREGRGVVLPESDSQVVDTVYPGGMNAIFDLEFHCDDPGDGVYHGLAGVSPVTDDGSRSHGGVSGYLVRAPAVCRREVPPVVAVGTHATVDATEAVGYAAGTDLFGVGEQAWLLAAGAGTAVHTATDGALRFDFRFATDPRYRVQHVRWEDGTDTLVSNGPDGYAVRAFIAASESFGFQFLGAIGTNITDIDRLPSAGDPSRTRNLLAVDNTTGDVLEITRSDIGIEHAVVLDDADLAVAGVAGRTVSVHPTSDGAGFLGATETDLFFFDGSGIDALGPVGTGLRLLDCDAGICAVPDFGGGEVVIFVFDGSSAPDPSSAARVPLGGAVTVDVRADGRVLVPSSTTRTVHRLTLDASLAIVEDLACAIGASAAAPFHASAIEGTELALVDRGADGQLEVVDLTSCTAP